MAFYWKLKEKWCGKNVLFVMKGLYFERKMMEISDLRRFTYHKDAKNPEFRSIFSNWYQMVQIETRECAILRLCFCDEYFGHLNNVKFMGMSNNFTLEIL